MARSGGGLGNLVLELVSLIIIVAVALPLVPKVISILGVTDNFTLSVIHTIESAFPFVGLIVLIMMVVTLIRVLRRATA